RGLGRLEGVLFPGAAVLAEAGPVDAALCGVRVRTDGVDLRDHADVRAKLLRREGGAHAGEASADDEDVVLVDRHAVLHLSSKLLLGGIGRRAAVSQVAVARKKQALGAPR